MNFVIGLRKPNTDIGTWNGAFVCGNDSQYGLFAAMFDNNSDFIYHPETIEHIISNYNTCLLKNWTPMTKEDIKKTSGIDKLQLIDIKTFTEINKQIAYK